MVVSLISVQIVQIAPDYKGVLLWRELIVMLNSSVHSPSLSHFKYLQCIKS